MSQPPGFPPWIWLLVVVASAATIISACSSLTASSKTGTTHPEKLVIFAAASLSEAFIALGEEFESNHPGVKLVFNFAGSQQLAQQLVQGAPADLFASANLEQMDAVIEQGRVPTNSQQVFAYNQLVVVLSPESEISIRRLQDLAQPGILLVLAERSVPAGKYARQFLVKAGQDPDYGPGYKQAVLANVVSYEENVRAVLAKVVLGEADAGVIYASDLAGVPAAQIRVLDIPPDLNVLASYFIAPLADSSQAEAAEEFTAFLLSDDGQRLLTRYGLQGIH